LARGYSFQHKTSDSGAQQIVLAGRAAGQAGSGARRIQGASGKPSGVQSHAGRSTADVDHTNSAQSQQTTGGKSPSETQKKPQSGTGAGQQAISPLGKQPAPSGSGARLKSLSSASSRQLEAPWDETRKSAVQRRSKSGLTLPPWLWLVIGGLVVLALIAALLLFIARSGRQEPDEARHSTASAPFDSQHVTTFTGTWDAKMPGTTCSAPPTF
jgi:hypothetical protein